MKLPYTSAFQLTAAFCLAISLPAHAGFWNSVKEQAGKARGAIESVDHATSEAGRRMGLERQEQERQDQQVQADASSLEGAAVTAHPKPVEKADVAAVESDTDSGRAAGSGDILQKLDKADDKRNIRVIIESYGLENIEKYEIESVRLGMTEDEATNILMDQGYVKTHGSPWQFNKNTNTGNMTFKYIASTTAPITGTRIVTSINHHQHFNKDVNLDAEDLYKKVVDQYGEPDSIMGNVNPTTMYYRISYSNNPTQIITYMKTSFPGGSGFTREISSKELASAITDVLLIYNRSQKSELDRKKPTVQVDF